MTMHWSKPYCGVSHCGALADYRRATVDDRGSFVILSKWWQGCGFSPNEATFDSVTAAKAAGERWITQGGG